MRRPKASRDNVLFPLGKYIHSVDRRNIDGIYDVEHVRGIATDKQFIKTKANLSDVNLTSYKLVAPQNFAFVSDTSRRGDKMSLAYNDSQETYIISPISTVFEIGKCEELLPEYLYLWFLRPEFDRYARYHSWGSARETFSMEDMLRVHIPVPDIETQRHLVEVWKGLDAIKTDNEALASPLMNLCMSYLDKMRKDYPLHHLSDGLIEKIERYNENCRLDIHSVRGVSNTKEIIKTRANVSGRTIKNFLVLNRSEFVFNRRTTRNGERLGLGFNETEQPILFTNDYVMFKIVDKNILLPEFLYLCFKRDEFDRYVRWDSWGSATEFFNWENMLRVQIPVPPLSIQQAIVDIYTCARESREIAVKAGELSKQACPALIRRGTCSIAS